MSKPMFAKRHYEAIATAMQEAHPSAADTDTPSRLEAEEFRWFVVRRTLADTLARDNGQFKRDRFERACEPGANVRAQS